MAARNKAKGELRGKARMREHLEAEPGLVEKAISGGWDWLLNGNLLCAARDDGMLVRLRGGSGGWALALPGIVPTISRGRRMRGWVRAGPDAFGDGAPRRKLLDAAPGFVRPLPAK